MNPDEQTTHAADAMLAAQQLKRSRVTAVVLATATVVSLIFLVFAFVQKDRADSLAAELAATKTALEVCRGN